MAAALCGKQQPFAHYPTAIRVKTPSLAINLCPPDLSVADFGDWHVHAPDGAKGDGADKGTCRMDFLVHNQLVGYALTGSCTPQSDGLHRIVIESLSAVNSAA